jgi:hypothetical protein
MEQENNSKQADPKLLFKQATLLHQSGQIVDAINIYQQLIKWFPRDALLLFLLGTAEAQRGNTLECLDLFDRSLAISPNNPDIYYNRGRALYIVKRFDDALLSLDRAIQLRPDNVEAHYNRGMILIDLKQFNDALRSFDRAIQLRPNYVQAHDNRGICLLYLARWHEALQSHDLAIQLKPDYAEAHYNRGIVLAKLQQLDAAIASYDQAISVKPDYAEAYSNRGVVLAELKQLDAAIASYDQAISVRPDFAEAYLNKSLALLLGGDFERGWELYEWRWNGEGSIQRKRNFVQPLWLGAESLRGKTILLHGEQGFGDKIQFCRYTKSVADLGAEVILEVEEPLIPLLSSLTGVSQFVVTGSALPAFDYYCPLLSLPLAFKTTLSTIPSSQGYLRSNDGKVTEWVGKLGTKTKPRIGIVWSGSATNKNDRNRSIVLSELIPHLPEELEYFSLQKEVRDIDKATLQAHPSIRHLGHEFNDFADTAAVCEQMDLVLSVDTSVAHLSGAIGKATWVLLPYSPDWRWLLDRHDSPWYPSIQLYRQATVGDWTSVFEKVNVALRKLIA